MTKDLFTRIAGVYDRMNRILSLGRDAAWRRRAVRLVAARDAQGGQPRALLDLACGTGDLTFALARAFPAATILGVDLTPAMLACARRKNTFAHVSFAEGNAETLADPTELHPSSFDLISCAFGFRNFADRRAALRGVRRLLAPDGQLLVLEFFRRPRAVLPPLTDRWVALLARLFAPRFADDYRYLRESMAHTVTEEEFIALAADEGLALRSRRLFLPCCSCLLFSGGGAAGGDGR